MNVNLLTNFTTPVSDEWNLKGKLVSRKITEDCKLYKLSHTETSIPVI